MGNYTCKKDKNRGSQSCSDEERHVFGTDPFWIDITTLHHIFYKSEDQCFLTDIQKDSAWIFTEAEDNSFSPTKLLRDYLNQEWPSFEEDTQLLVATLWLVRFDRHAAADALLNFFQGVGEHLKFWFLTESQLYHLAQPIDLAAFKNKLQIDVIAQKAKELYHDEFCQFWLSEWLPFFIKLQCPQITKRHQTYPSLVAVVILITPH
jgi:hypothetical protein